MSRRITLALLQCHFNRTICKSTFRARNGKFYKYQFKGEDICSLVLATLVKMFELYLLVVADPGFPEGGVNLLFNHFP